MTHLPVFLRPFLRFTRVLLFLPLVLHVLFHRVRARLALRETRAGTGKGRGRNRVAEKDKQDKSRNSLHKDLHETGLVLRPYSARRKVYAPPSYWNLHSLFG
jgi:hypothetical protein